MKLHRSGLSFSDGRLTISMLVAVKHLVKRHRGLLATHDPLDQRRREEPLQAVDQRLRVRDLLSGPQPVKGRPGSAKAFPLLMRQELAKDRRCGRSCP